MGRFALCLAALLLPTAALAQGGPPGGGGPGGGGPPGGGRGGMGRPQPIKPLKFEKLEKAVRAMFQAADTDRDGFITISELQKIVEGRRDAVIQARFQRIDADRNGMIDHSEFLTWQRSLGSAVMEEPEPLTRNGGLVPDSIEPVLGDSMEDGLLRRLIEPLNAVMLANANTNYDTGVTFEELLAWQRKRFDKADSDRNGELSMEELRPLGPQGGERGPGPGGQRGPLRPGGAPSD
ncbi:MAG: EF-hand domain-containing protein [Novosphingobium sp.]